MQQTLKKLSPPSWSLHDITATDTEFVRLLYRSTREAELSSLPWTEAQKIAFCEMQQRAQTMGYAATYPQAEYRLIRVGAQAAGRLINAWTDQGLVLVDIALLPTFWGCGLGTMLLTSLQQEAAAQDKALLLSVDKLNRAMKLYSRLGFSIVGEHDLRIQMAWKRVVRGKIVAA